MLAKEEDNEEDQDGEESNLGSQVLALLPWCHGGCNYTQNRLTPPSIPPSEHIHKQKVVDASVMLDGSDKHVNFSQVLNKLVLIVTLDAVCHDISRTHPLDAKF